MYRLHLFLYGFGRSFYMSLIWLLLFQCGREAKKGLGIWDSTCQNWELGRYPSGLLVDRPGFKHTLSLQKLAKARGHCCETLISEDVNINRWFIPFQSKLLLCCSRRTWIAAKRALMFRKPGKTCGTHSVASLSKEVPYLPFCWGPTHFALKTNNWQQLCLRKV